MTDNPVNTDNNEIQVIDESQIKQFQSLYYLIKGKRDTDIKLFSDYKQFSRADILELNDKVYRKLSLHHLVTNIVNVTVGLDNREIKTFGNWPEFKNTDWNISASTKYTVLEWDFNLILPNQTHQVPQTHTLRVRIGNNLKASEMIQFVFQGGDEAEIEESQAQMSCKIDFINAQICNELKTIVSDWYDTLPNNSEDHKLIKFILKNEMKIRNFVVLSFLTAGIILANFIFSTFFSSTSSLLPESVEQRLFLFLTSSIALFYIFNQAGILYGNRITRKQIEKLQRNPMFDFTKGDKNKFDDVNKNNRKYIKKLIGTIIIGIAVNGVTYLIGLVVDYIY